MRDSKEYTLLDAQASAASGKAILVEDFKTCVLSFASASSANLTVKFQGSIQDTCPTFSSAQSPANHWDYVEVIDLQDGAAIDGDTGIALVGTDDNRMVEVNINGLKWLCATVTARSAGNVTVKARVFRDNN